MTGEIPCKRQPPLPGVGALVLVVQKVEKGFLGGKMRHTAVKGYVCASELQMSTLCKLILYQQIRGNSELDSKSMFWSFSF